MAEYGRIHTDGSRSGGQPVLKPCPFCGETPTLQWHSAPECWVECSCGAIGPQGEDTSTDDHIALWNTRQPTHSNIFDASDVQKHTLIVDQDYSSHTVKVKSLDDSQPTQSDALREALEAAPLIGRTESVYDFIERQSAWLNGPYRAAMQEQSK